jgi:HAE1 family hydrophobic/amphiphilic exporter-1
MSAGPETEGDAGGPHPIGGLHGAAAAMSAEAAQLAQAMRRFEFTTTRPVAILMVFLAVMVFGAFSIRLLPMTLMPDISYPKLTVRTEYPGAAPAEVENNVSRPLEEILGVVTGLTRVESISRAGYSDVILEFAWNTDMDDANQDVLEKLDQIKPTLPTEVEQPLILRYDPSLDPVLTLSLAGEGSGYEGIPGLKRLRRIGEREVRRLLEPIDGVASVKVKGGLEEEIEIEVDEGQLRRTGIGIDTIVQRLGAENVNLAGGSLRDGTTQYLIRTVNEFESLADIGGVVIVSRDGRDIRLRDLAKVTPGYKDRDVITRVGGREAVEIEIYKEADANIVDMASRVRVALANKVQPKLRDEYGATLVLTSDRSRFIESSIREVLNTAVTGGLLAVLILLLFLRDAKATAIVAVSIPISILVTFAPMNLAGVSLNIMSLGGMALGIGMLVDNSIVVLESIHRCVEEGDDLLRGTVRGVAEVGGAVVASTLTTVAVFLPMVFVEGVAGQMFGDLGLTVVFSLLASLAVALYFIPMLASRRPPSANSGAGGLWKGARELVGSWGSLSDFLADLRWWWRRPLLRLLVLPWVLVRLALHLPLELVGKLLVGVVVAVSVVARVNGWIASRVVRLVSWPVLAAFAWMIGGLEAAYPPLIRASLRNRALVVLAMLGSAGFLVWAVPRLESELIPELHQGELTVEANLPVGTPLERTDVVAGPLERATLAGVPLLRTLTTTLGSERDSADSGERGEHTIRLRVRLGPASSAAAADPAAPAGATATAASAAADADAEREVPAALIDEARLTDPAAAEEAALAALREIVADVPDLTVSVSRPALFSFKTPVEVEVRGYDLDELAAATTLVAERLRAVPGLRDVKASIQPGSPEIQIVYDRVALARLGLDVRKVAELVRDKVQGNEATQYNRADRKVPVRVRVADADEATLQQLRELVVNPGGARPVALAAVAELSLGRGPNEIRRVDQQRVGVVTANLEGVGLGTITAQLEQLLGDELLPPGVETAVTGQSEEWERSSSSLALALALSVFLVYVIMASQFESLLYPLIILVTIPLALVGVVGVQLLLDVPLSVVVFLGAIMLAGIVVNNAIVLVDYVNQLKARGYAVGEALEIAGRVRLRPILMTTLTTVLGLVPMAFGIGDGAEIRAPMAIVVIAGLSFSTVLTLVVIPTLYAMVDGWLAGRPVRDPAGQLRRELADVRPEQLEPEFGGTAAGAAPRPAAAEPGEAP